MFIPNKFISADFSQYAYYKKLVWLCVYANRMIIKT